jgi:arginyl-tRNA synthetase|nr:arginine--tRNA ligase [Kofleriaceae bacterium]
MAHYTPLHQAAADVVARLANVDAADLKVETPPKPAMGDLAVGCFAIAKAQGKNPAAVAQDIATAFQPTGMLASASAAGPFVNFRADRAAALGWTIEHATRGTLVPTELGAGKSITIDYSSPNISKHLAYHHIRSTMIGHSLVQIFRALGYRVIGINHLGDWGKTHGMLVAAWHKWGPIEPLDISVLNDLYVRYREAIKANPALDGEARAYFKKLEAGDAETRALWTRFRDISLAEYQTVYDALGIQFDEIRGESAYEHDIPRVMSELAASKLLTESEGATVVWLDGEKEPVIIKTSDDTTVYATRDLATAEYRWTTYHPARSLYVVDRGQALHFKQVFKVLALMGHADAAKVCEHVPFGLVRIGGKKTGTRTGQVVLLKDVLAEAEQRVRDVIVAGGADLSPEVLASVAPVVGIGAVVFANLASQRERDVDFEWEKVIALTGDSGPYLQYSHARCASIVRKAAKDGLTVAGEVDYRKLGTDAEWAVARRLMDYADVVVRAAAVCEPHLVCHYLLDLAATFSRWYTEGNGDASLRVLCEDAPTRTARLALVGAVQATLASGLGLLGIAAPEQM